MKVPSYIKESIRKNAKANAAATTSENAIREWLTKNNINNDAVIDQLIDCCNLANLPEQFIEFLENDASYFEGNSEGN